MNEANIYAAPSTDVTPTPEVVHGFEPMLKALKSQSTWRLVFLSIITLGIYFAHYIRRQTNILNQNLSGSERISGSFISAILVLSYVSAFLMVPYSLVEEGHIIESISDLADGVLNILLLVWAFKARNRMNVILRAQAGSSKWFHGLWTFLFIGLYFNYKVNQLNQEA